MRRLVTIPISHFCEKARWALDRAGLGYREERHVQGVHQLASRRAGGHGTLPVLICEAGVLAESEDIMRWADPGLFGAPGPERDDVLAVSRWLDAGLGPDARRWIYAHMLGVPELMLAYNNAGVPAWEDRAIRALWPLTLRFARRKLSLTATTIADDEPRVRRAFDEVAQRLSDGRRHLCGDRLSAADITFASLAAAVVLPPQYGVALPPLDALPAALAGSVRAFRAHPAGAYALELFATERRRVAPA